MKSVIFFLVLVNIITVVYCHVLHMRTYELLKAVAEYVEAQRELNKEQQKTNKIIFDALRQNPLAGYVNQYIKQMERMKDGRRKETAEVGKTASVSCRTHGKPKETI